VIAHRIPPALIQFRVVSILACLLYSGRSYMKIPKINTLADPPSSLVSEHDKSPRLSTPGPNAKLKEIH